MQTPGVAAIALDTLEYARRLRERGVVVAGLGIFSTLVEIL